MKYDIVLSGVGGQGILSIAAVLGRAVLSEGLHLKQTEVHGMAQRGGAVQSHLRISSDPIHSDVIPRGRADMILSMEPMEALRYLDWLKPEGWLIANVKPIENIAAYPAMHEVRASLEKVPNRFVFDAFELATQEGSPRAVNMAVLGAASPRILLASETLEKSIAAQFEHKGEKVIENNLRVYRAARQRAEEA